MDDVKNVGNGLKLLHLFKRLQNVRRPDQIFQQLHYDAV